MSENREGDIQFVGDLMDGLQKIKTLLDAGKAKGDITHAIDAALTAVCGLYDALVNPAGESDRPGHDPIVAVTQATSNLLEFAMLRLNETAGEWQAVRDEIQDLSIIIEMANAGSVLCY